MNGIFLTEQGKQEIEAKIVELEKYDYGDARLNGALEGDLYRLKEILSSATILPVEESWKNLRDMLDINTLPISYKNGVIIKHKQDFGS